MGYYSNYKLHVPIELHEQFSGEFTESWPAGLAKVAIYPSQILWTEPGFGAPYEFDVDRKNPTIYELWEAKAYDVHLLLEMLTKKFPNFVFTLMRDGEESGDFDKRVAFNGVVKRYVPELLYPPVDLSTFK